MFEFLRTFDLNDFCDRLHERKPVVYDALSIVGRMLRALWRIYLPLAVCFWLMHGTLAQITADANMRVNHFLPLALIALVLPFMIMGDRRLQYDALSRRDGVASPSLGHDLGVMLGNLSFWMGLASCVLAITSNVPYLAVEFARLMPDASFATHAMYAATLPTAAVVLYYIAWWWGAMRFAYRCADPEDEPEPVLFASLGRTLANGFAWLFGFLLLLFVGERAIVFAVFTAVMLIYKYWLGFLILVPVVAALIYCYRVIRVLRIRRSGVAQLKSEMDAAGIRYEFEKHPVLSALFGGDKISLRIFIRDEVLSVRMVSSIKKKIILVVAPDGNIGFLHSIALFRVPLRSTKRIMTAAGMVEEDSPALTQWMVKRETAFVDEKYPSAEKIYLINPTPTDWRMGELKKTVPLSNGSDAYGYHMWTVSAFCRHIRLRNEGEHGQRFGD